MQAFYCRNLPSSASSSNSRPSCSTLRTVTRRGTGARSVLRTPNGERTEQKESVAGVGVGAAWRVSTPPPAARYRPRIANAGRAAPLKNAAARPAMVPLAIALAEAAVVCSGQHGVLHTPAAAVSCCIDPAPHAQQGASPHKPVLAAGSTLPTRAITSKPTHRDDEGHAHRNEQARAHRDEHVFAHREEHPRTYREHAFDVQTRVEASPRGKRD
ncbi:hypothetical protein B0H12DRAFT_1245432 [Mycena haematopus]|nr:hypothetical protein B0H12DRAFT_1245432 [Mycena haematopus]